MALAHLRSRKEEGQPRASRVQLIGVGHSLGGLYLRNALGLLFRTGYFHQETGVLEPCSYFSICSPHLGSRIPPRGGGIVGGGLRLVMSVGSSARMQTIRDLTMQDEAELPILLEMSQPESVYAQALRLFTITLVSVTHHDRIVAFASSSLLLANPFPPPTPATVTLVVGASGFSSEHEELLLQFADPDTLLIKRSTSSEALGELDLLGQDIEGSYITDTARLLELRPQVYENLCQLSWRRLNVQFPSGGAIERLLTHQMPLAKVSNMRLGVSGSVVSKIRVDKGKM